VKDSLKFFQAYIREMIDIGGENLPKTIATKLGIKLAKIYKKRGLADNLESAIKQIYLALNAKPKINKVDDSTLEIFVKHPKKIGPNFCVIGGKYDPSRAEIFQNSICIPYTMGFLNGISPNLQFKPTIKQCIIADNVRTCHYILKIKKENLSKRISNPDISA